MARKQTDNQIVDDRGRPLHFDDHRPVSQAMPNGADDNPATWPVTIRRGKWRNVKRGNKE